MDKAIKALMGKTIEAVLTFTYRGGESKRLEPDHILFTDKKTIMSFDEQDTYDYHDCSASARIVMVTQNKKEWARIRNDPDYKESNFDGWLG